MKQIFDPVICTANDLTDAAQRIADDGVQFFRSSLGKLPLLSSVRAIESNEFEDRDEIHYFLVPFRLSNSGYALYTQRVLPEGTGPENALPKARVFHLPGEGTVDTLEKLIIDQLKDKNIKALDSTPPIADRLDMIAEEIDHQSNLITGGLVVIGGVVAVANPLLGIGIAAKALLPTLGSKLSKHGINHFSDWLRDKKLQSSEKAAITEAQREVKNLAPEAKTDQTLALLEEALSTADSNHDPSLSFASFMNSPAEAASTMLAASAIYATYEQCINDSASHEGACLHPADITWLRSLAELKAD